MGISSPVKDTAWIGPLERAILGRLLDMGVEVFRPSWLELDIDRRRLHDCIKRLVARGIIERVAWGVYRVRVEELHRAIALPVRRLVGSVKDSTSSARGTRGPRVVRGPFFDNVRGYTLSGYVGGDRGRVLEPGDLVFFDSVSYAEVLYRVRGLSIPGQLVFYTDDYGVRVEWRPPSGYVRHNGLGSAIRMYWEVVLAAFKSLALLIAREGPPDVRSRAVRFVDGLLATLRTP